jgi:subfamily B ATP-binding cassette protein MsbA
MEQLMKGRTSVIVAHRLSTIRNVDRVFVLEAGRVVEMGTEAELLTHAGVYSRLGRLK